MSAPRAAVATRLAGAWFLLALAALGLSALCAIFLVVARMPFLGQGAAVFRTALVLHVDLAVLVWFLAFAAGAWTLAAGAGGALRWIPFGLAAIGTAAMLAAASAGDALPLLTNYVPLLDHPLFLAGLALFVGAVMTSGVSMMVGVWRSAAPWRHAALWSVLALFVALAVLALDWRTATGMNPIGIDDLIWGAGHALQFVHILLLMGAWHALGRPAAAAAGIERALPALYALAFLPVLAAPAIAVALPVGSVEYRAAFTELMRWGTWPAAALLCLGVAVGLARLANARPLDEDEKGLALSLFVFALGCLLGAAIRGESLAVPAHYHGTVGAVTLAYMLWLRRLAGEFGLALPTGAVARRLPLLYGLGIVLLVAGLAVAGQLGIPRKTPHIDLAVDSAGYIGAMATAGLGGFVALAAVLAIASVGGRAAWRSRRPTAPTPRRRDVRGWAIAATVLLVAGGGWLFDLLPGGAPANNFSARKHAAEKIRADVEARFQQGVIMLHAKQYDHALTAFHRVLQLSPELPEAYVNMGFALVGLKRYKEAGDFFESATQLRRSQANAYYGLAIALEGMGDLPGALGAMQTYVHLSKADDPFRRKAEAAIWEWREKLAARRGGGTPSN